jgi:hypothetical protein
MLAAAGAALEAARPEVVVQVVAVQAARQQLLELQTLVVAAAAAQTLAQKQVAMVVPVLWLSVTQVPSRLLCLQQVPQQ